jgi:hypothetical protein
VLFTNKEDRVVISDKAGDVYRLEYGLDITHKISEFLVFGKFSIIFSILFVVHCLAIKFRKKMDYPMNLFFLVMCQLFLTW